MTTSALIFFRFQGLKKSHLVLVPSWDFGVYWNRYRKNLVLKKVPEPVPEKYGTEKSTGTSIGKIWYLNKVPVLEKNQVPSHSGVF